VKKSDRQIEQTLLSLKKGNKFAFREIFDSYEKRLYYFIFSMTKSDYATEDILQEVFIKIWLKREDINTAYSFDSFIYTIAKNLTYNYLRTIANQKSLKEELWRNLTYINAQTENTLLLSEYETIVDDILETLPIQKRSIFVLSKQQGKSNQEIADLLGISPKTVKNHLWKTLQIIKVQLQPHLTDSTISIIMLLTFLYRNS
tara:strand:- start:34971 stop:35576 length:606 start_codon:yes stop_codon:yes gene_type:complete